MNIIPSLQDRPSGSTTRPFPSILSLESEGSTAQTDDAAAAVASSQGRFGAAIRVMLVEERNLVRQGINALLAQRDDITVVGQTPDCHQAVTLAEKKRPDVLIIALGLILRNGLDFFRRLLEAGCGTRALVLMPHTHDHALAEHVASAGAVGFLTEQAESQLLTTAVRDVHAQNRFADHGKTAWSADPFPAITRHRPNGPDADFSRLTSRELEVLQLIAEGNANKQTASKLGISIKTVEKHRQHMMTKLDIHETASLTRFAVYAGIA